MRDVPQLFDASGEFLPLAHDAFAALSPADQRLYGHVAFAYGSSAQSDARVKAAAASIKHCSDQVIAGKEFIKEHFRAPTHLDLVRAMAPGVGIKD